MLNIGGLRAWYSTQLVIISWFVKCYNTCIMLFMKSESDIFSLVCHVWMLYSEQLLGLFSDRWRFAIMKYATSFVLSYKWAMKIPCASLTLYKWPYRLFILWYIHVHTIWKRFSIILIKHDLDSSYVYASYEFQCEATKHIHYRNLIPVISGRLSSYMFHIN